MIECAFCKGSGVHPHKVFTRFAFNRKDSMSWRWGAREACPNCDGTGHKGDGNRPCTLCGGMGMTPQEG